MELKLRVDGVSFDYGSFKALKDVKLEIEPGEVVSLVGPNGSGKTTLIKCINRILKPQTGTVLLDEKDLSKIGRNDLARSLGYVPQASKEVFPYNVFEAVLMGRKPYITWKVDKKDLALVTRILRQLNLEHLQDRKLNELSGGQRQKVLLGRALAQEPRVFILDEPTSNLDIKNQLEVLQIVRNLSRASNCSMIIALHDLNMAARFSDKLIMLKDGLVCAVGTPKEVMTEKNLSSIYEVHVSVHTCQYGPYILPLEPIAKEKAVV